MKRRNFLYPAGLTSLGLTFGSFRAYPELKKREKADKGYEVEGREKWRKGGHSKVTYDFKDQVFNAPNLLASISN